MIEVAIKEAVIKEGMNSGINDIPSFAKNMKSENIKDMSEASKPISQNSDLIIREETRDLTDEEKSNVQRKTDWSDEQMEKCTIDKEGVIHYKCDNEHMEGKTHEPSGVDYVRKVVDINGVKVEVVVPDFDSRFNAQLPEDLLQQSNPRQFKECNQQLKDSIVKNPELRNKFTKEQLADIMDGKTPEGYTWHHDVEPGKMQLVETKIHDRTQGGAPHTGGKSLWGGSYS